MSTNEQIELERKRRRSREARAHNAAARILDRCPGWRRHVTTPGALVEWQREHAAAATDPRIDWEVSSTLALET